ncbi:MAG: c-type cytochrome [Bacteroidia bacterium]|jgi:thiosulfate dehydrogenase|nr:c-type cytochrome [Bacteroidia bacterium]
MKNSTTLLQIFLVATLFIAVTLTVNDMPNEVNWNNGNAEKTSSPDSIWVAPNLSDLEANTNAKQILYGHNIISQTSKYFGPNGSISNFANGMNCQNCHLNAGTKPFGNNYAAVAATYPKFRERSGSIETIAKRINDCFERSLNGKAIDTQSNEMLAIIAYINWLGKDVPKNKKPMGSGILELAYLNRAASPQNGEQVYKSKCITCHQSNGGGQLNIDKIGYAFPPLWGNNSFNMGAGLYRLSRMAGYVKVNMPLGATYNNPILTDEEAWDVAAFINTQNRPYKNLEKDWPNIAAKPVDHPFGPFSDNFSEQQHKLGPFEPIKKSRKKSI